LSAAEKVSIAGDEYVPPPDTPTIAVTGGVVSVATLEIVRMVPDPPTAQQEFKPRAKMPRRVQPVPEARVIQCAPPSEVENMVPMSATAQACVASLKVTDRMVIIAQDDLTIVEGDCAVQRAPPSVVPRM
jgi:hypothetical protein